jgi:hypothetical protein
MPQYRCKARVTPVTAKAQIAEKFGKIIFNLPDLLYHLIRILAEVRQHVRKYPSYIGQSGHRRDVLMRYPLYYAAGAVADLTFVGFNLSP